MECPRPFGDYMLLEQIATGGMAEVYRARAEGLAGFAKIVVVKHLIRPLMDDQEIVDLFVSEAKIAVELMHVNIVQVFELGLHDGMHFMVLEHLDGLDLARLVSKALPRGPMPIPVALFVAAEVLTALSFAHGRKDRQGKPLEIVHCDISPQNVLVSHSGEVKITDFGISRAAFQARSLHDTLRGKFAYMSPEQIRSKPLDGRSDLFSLAVVLYEVLTGRRLFKRGTREETTEAVKSADVPPVSAYRPEASNGVEVFLSKALSRRADDRYQSADEMLSALREVIVGDGYGASHQDMAAYVREALSDVSELGPHASEVQEAVLVLSMSTVGGRGRLPVGSDWVDGLAGEEVEVWERSEHGALLVWRGQPLEDHAQKALEVAHRVRARLARCEVKVAVGIAPGVTRIHLASGRPPGDWELTGPFYLARWLMNRSGERGRTLVTQRVARWFHGDVGVRQLGTVTIQEDRSISVYEVASARPSSSR